MFRQLGLIGCGLMGGSFALALRRAGLVQHVVGYSKSPSTTERAKKLGVIDVAAGDLGIDPAPSVGDRVETSGDAPRLAGTVVQADSWRMALLLDEPAEGTAFLAAEGDGPYVGVSVWSYLYGDAGAEAAATAEPAWSEWLGARGPSEPEAE